MLLSIRKRALSFFKSANAADEGNAANGAKPSPSGTDGFTFSAAQSHMAGTPSLQRPSPHLQYNQHPPAQPTSSQLGKRPLEGSSVFSPVAERVSRGRHSQPLQGPGGPGAASEPDTASSAKRRAVPGAAGGVTPAKPGWWTKQALPPPPPAPQPSCPQPGAHAHPCTPLADAAAALATARLTPLSKPGANGMASNAHPLHSLGSRTPLTPSPTLPSTPHPSNTPLVPGSATPHHPSLLAGVRSSAYVTRALAPPSGSKPGGTSLGLARGVAAAPSPQPAWHQQLQSVSGTQQLQRAQAPTPHVTRPTPARWVTPPRSPVLPWCNTLINNRGSAGSG
ncbi:hypothetical protein QJQ45_016549 [Haematococcus lacustris]|nr:hypothetical protein QJQ45_016549 [Haematococcus lacustris]